MTSLPIYLNNYRYSVRSATIYIYIYNYTHDLYLLRETSDGHGHCPQLRSMLYVVTVADQT